jgi:AcrR family transcriptional regulator
MARPLKTENEDTKGTIFKYAIELFMRFGYEGASIRDITKKCGIRESSFYYHFKSKEDLLDSIYNAMDTFLENSKPSLLQIESMLTSLSPIQFFEMFFSAYSDSHDELSNKIALFIMKEDFRNERAKEYVLEKNCRDMAKFITNILEKYKALVQQLLQKQGKQILKYCWILFNVLKPKQQTYQSLEKRNQLRY